MIEGEKTVRLPPLYRLITRDVVTSTNEVARELAESGAEDGTLVWAREQTAGRGRRGKDWASPPGNLYLSLILRPEIPLHHAPQLSFVTALGVGSAVGAIVPPLTELTFKWPNDVLVGGKKVAGILLEAGPILSGQGRDEDPTAQYLIMGVGINVQHFPQRTRYPATSLQNEAGHTLEIVSVLEGFSKHLLPWVNTWMSEGFAPIRTAWLNRAHRMGQRIEVKAGEVSAISGIFEGIDDTGALQLREDDGTVSLHSAGEVSFSAPETGEGG